MTYIYYASAVHEWAEQLQSQWKLVWTAECPKWVLAVVLPWHCLNCCVPYVTLNPETGARKCWDWHKMLGLTLFGGCVPGVCGVGGGGWLGVFVCVLVHAHSMRVCVIWNQLWFWIWGCLSCCCCCFSFLIWEGGWGDKILVIDPTPTPTSSFVIDSTHGVMGR